MARLRFPGLALSAEIALSAALDGLIKRLDALERKPTAPAIVTADFVAREGQYVRVQAPSTGITIVLPTPTSTNRGAQVTFSIETTGPVRFVSVNGLVNGESYVVSSALGTFTAVSDGENGWSVGFGISSSGSALDADYVLGAAHGSLPSAAVGADSTEIAFSFTSGGLAQWSLRTASVVFAKLQNLAALSVLGRASNTSGVMAAITAPAGRRYLRSNATFTGIEWGALTSDEIPAGPPGEQGDEGPPGDMGPPGPPGAAGAAGLQGPPGIEGPEGPEGPMGPPGVTGATGPQGPQGAPGNDGSDGPEGAPGAPGAAGVAGAAGQPGALGSDGIEGPEGPMGPPGPTGATGPMGLQGPPGPQGEQGDTGPQGEQGPLVGWDTVLGIQSHSGGFSPVIDSGSYLGFGPSPPTVGANEQLRADGNFLGYASGGFAMVGGTSFTAQTLSGPCSFTAGGAVSFISGTGTNVSLGPGSNGSVVATVTGTGIISLVHAASGLVSISSYLRISETAASTPSMTSGQALFWVKNDAPNNPYFTDDTNADRKILTAPLPLADMATMPAATVLGLQQDASGPAVPVNLTGAEVGELTRYEFAESFSLAAGTHTLTLDARTTKVFISVTSAADANINQIVHGSNNLGARVTIVKEGTQGRVVLVDSNTNSNSIWTAGSTIGSTTVALAHYNDAVTVSNTLQTSAGGGSQRWRVESFKLLNAWDLAQAIALGSLTYGVPFAIRVPFTAAATGASDDITIYSAAAPFAFRIIDVTLIISTAIGGSLAQLRDTAGGVGSVLSGLFSSAATGTVRNNDTQTRTVASGGSVFLRRGDRGIAGEVIITAFRTA